MAAAAAVAVSRSPGGPGHRGGLRPRTQAHRSFVGRPSSSRPNLQTALAAAGKPPGEAEEQVPAWARPGADEPPPGAREGGGSAQEPGAGQVPFYAYLLASAVTAIAAIGSIFEYTNQRPVFGIINSDSALYAPLLGFFVFTSIPTSGVSVVQGRADSEQGGRGAGPERWPPVTELTQLQDST